MSPSKFESQATGSPTKLSVPNRKIRNQPSNRNHDIEFAAEISQSLIVQVRNLQALLAEREEEVRDLKNDKSALEIESESLHQRLKALDESEHRYKEENWNLETRLQELSSQQRDAVDREKKLTLSLSQANTEKLAVQNKLDEVKLSHAKLAEDHAASIKHADIELGTAKRNMVQAESERSALKRKIDDLTNQNQELAKAFSQQRGRTLEREPVSGQSEDDFETATDNATPEHSPPPSPIKGTPRHSMLETETMKTSLHHAQRTIQSQRNQIHREKTEKLELRRMIQDLRDDLERSRNESSSGTSNRRSRKVDSKEFKKNPRLLGNFRSSRQEILADDPEWEDNQEHSPRSAIAGSTSLSQVPDVSADTTDHFETANEASESAFETANDERATETEDFQTTNEAFSGNDDAETETETTSRGFGRMRPPPSLPAGLSRHMPRESFDSTASTSTDDDDVVEVKTPTASIASQRNRFRLSRGPFGRNARQASEEPAFKSSPAASFISSNGDTPQGGQQSLFAELQDFAGSDEESIGNATPSRRSVRSVTPGSTRRPYSPPPALPALPKVIMVDSGVMTEPVNIRDSDSDVDSTLPVLAPAMLSPGNSEPERPKSMQSVIASGENRDSTYWASNSSRPVSTISYSDAGSQIDPDMGAKLAQFPVPPSMVLSPPAFLSVSGIHSESLEPREEPWKPVTFGFTSIYAENLDPVEEPEVVPTPPSLAYTLIAAENLSPIAEPEVIPPPLGYTSITMENVDPIAEPETPRPILSLSTVHGKDLEPVEEPETPLPPLGISQITSENLSPILEPEIPAPLLSIGRIGSQHWEPREELPPPLPSLAMTTLQTEMVEPREEPEAPKPALSLSGVLGEELEPVAEPEPEPEPTPVAMAALTRGPETESEAETVVLEPPSLSISSITAENVEPIKEPEVVVARPSLGVSTIYSENLQPVTEPEPVPVQLGYSTIDTQKWEPVLEPQPIPPVLGYSAIGAQYWEPIKEPEPIPPHLAYSVIGSQYWEPVAEPDAVRPLLAFSPINKQNLEPLAEPEHKPVYPALGYSRIAGENLEPLAEPELDPVLVALGYSSISRENVEPVSEPVPNLAMSQVGAESVSPVVAIPPTFAYSQVAAEMVRPATPPATESSPMFGFTPISTIETEPMTPRSPKRDAFIMPRDMDEVGTDSSLVIAEDETRQSPRDVVGSQTPDSQQPFREISNNAGARNVTSDQGAQTSLTAGEIDQLFSSRGGHAKAFSISSVGSPGTTGTVRIHRPDDGDDVFRDATGSPAPRTPSRGRTAEASPAFHRPSSAASVASGASGASGRTTIHDPPPLPSNHRELIEAARTGSSGGPAQPQQQAPGSMGPPAWPASALKNRPHTPKTKDQRPTSGHSARAGPTPRAMRGQMITGGPLGPMATRPMSPGRLTARSRQSSVSSFASEIDARFGMRPGAVGPGHLEDMPASDSRMIQAITQTMIGEYLWKYTRKTGRGDMSEKRHRRYFWLHPYTRTLYWSDGDPASASRHELKAKSVPIEAVRVVTDDNPMPPGLHRKSLIVVAPGRSVKFTCTTGQRHETWFNALSYLLMRSNEENQTDVEEVAQNITQDDVDEFNPQFGQRPANGVRSRPSLSSYNSRTTRNQSPPADMMSIPTLTPNAQRNAQPISSAQRQSTGTLSKFSGYFRSSSSRISGNLGSLRVRGASGQNQSIYEASEVHDSAEDLREIIEQQDRDADRLENVRACCDGKHDVGTLHHHSRRGRHGGPSATSTPMASMRSRA